MDKLITVAQPGAVYGNPLPVGDRTIITASEVSVAMGFGYGGGGKMGLEAGPGPGAGGVRARRTPLAGGGGGGSASSARPVAVIEVGPERVRIEPVVDATKVALALFVTMGALVVTLGRIWRAGQWYR